MILGNIVTAETAKVGDKVWPTPDSVYAKDQHEGFEGTIVELRDRGYQLHVNVRWDNSTKTHNYYPYKDLYHILQSSQSPTEILLSSLDTLIEKLENNLLLKN